MNDFHLWVLASFDWHALSTRWILTLAHFLWQGAAIGLLTAVLLAIFRHSSARARHGICLLALASFIPCLVVTWGSVDVGKYVAASVVPGRPALDTDPISPASPFTASEVRDSREPASFPATGTDNTQVLISDDDASAAATPVSTPPETAGNMISRIAPLIAGAYFLGVLAFLVRTSLGLWGGRKLRTLSQQICNSELISLIEQQARSIGLKPVPVVLYCSRVAVPTVVGVLKPVVLLPASLVMHLETDQLAAILSHEFAHIRRHDLFVNLLQRLIESVLFFHPAVWWISRRISLEREHCCDDLASASGFGNLQYAGALLRMAELSLPQRSRKFASQLVALSTEGSSATHFSRRIERLLNVPGTPRLAVSRLSVLFAVVFSTISVGVLAQIADQQPADQKPITATNQENKEEVAAVAEEESFDKDVPVRSQSTEPSTTTETEDDDPERPKAPPEGLQFLLPYPKLYALSLDMTEVQFLTIVQREELKIQKDLDGPTYSILTGDGHIVIVMFGDNGKKCSGIQRIRGEVPEAKTPPAIIDSNGVYWSEFVTDGLRVGAKLLAKYGQLTAGEKLVVQYYLLNETNGKQTVSLVPSTPVFPTLGTGNRIELSLFPGDSEARNFSIGPGQSVEDPAHRVEIDTTGFPPGVYRVMARNFFWRPDPANPNHQDGFPARLELPLTIAGKETDSGDPPQIPEDSTDGIDWGAPVAGLQVGSRFRGDSALFEPGSSPQVQLFVRNVTRNPVEVRVFLPHPMDGWLINIENPQGDHVQMERTFIDIPSPERSFSLKVAAGETLPLTGVKYNLNGGFSEIKNSSFSIERNKPEGNFRPGGALVSQGGEYRAIHTVSMKRDDIPGVRLAIDSGRSTFEVNGPELKPKTSVKENEQNSSENGEAAIRLWKARLVDGMTGKPLPGIAVRVKGSVTGKAEPQPIELVSSGEGIITVPLRDGMVTLLDTQTAGWWRGGWPWIGQRLAIPGQPILDNQQPDPDTPREIKLWRGATVKGKLLYPDKSPAGGVLLNVGVYLHNMDWKKRLGMDLTFYSWDHGEWPNWSRSIMTNEDGTFTTTVPPAEARSWVRVGTTTLGFASVNPERIDAEGTGRALAICVPFEANIGYRGADYGYQALESVPENEPDNGTLNFGTLQLEAGVHVRGRVVDSDGNGLANVCLMTEGPHGPFAGRSTWSGEDGRFQFLPVEPGSLMIHPDARLRDADRSVASRDVQAVFIHQKYAVPAVAGELIVQAVPHVELEFEWIDRRANKNAPVSYYGEFRVVGRYPLEGEEPVYWHGETTLIERDGRKFLVVKVPRKLMNPTLTVSRDSIVTASYEDETGKVSGPGQVQLGDITKPIRRIIYGDEPKKPERSGN